MSVNIYVGNLSYDMTEGKLSELFGAHGAVTSAKIITDQYSGRSKGFGFIKDSVNNDSVFVHINSISGPVKENDKVTFNVESGHKGLNAVNVVLVK